MKGAAKQVEPPLPSKAQIRTMIRIATERAALVEQLKEAILNGDAGREHALARRVCGLPPEPGGGMAANSASEGQRS